MQDDVYDFPRFIGHHDGFDGLFDCCRQSSLSFFRSLAARDVQMSAYHAERRSVRISGYDPAKGQDPFPVSGFGPLPEFELVILYPRQKSTNDKNRQHDSGRRGAVVQSISDASLRIRGFVTQHKSVFRTDHSVTGDHIQIEEALLGCR